MKYFLLAVLAAACSATASSQSTTIIQRDPQIERMVKEVSADTLHAYIYKLVSFGTRNTLSTKTDPKRGIGAAANWILGKFNQFAATAGGRLTARLDTSSMQPDGRRVDVPVVLTNVVATLKGTNPDDHRIFIISGHMDAMRTNVLDRVGDAPGANDDGSGTAAVMECARIMSRMQFPATIIFVTVCGEEQGLLGAGFMAANAKKNNWEIGAVLNNDIMGSNNSNQTNIIENTKVRVFSEGLPMVGMDEKKAAEIRSMGIENDGPSRQLARYIKETGERYVDNLQVVMVYRPDRFLRGGDHQAYQQNGFTAVRITEMNENYYHQHQDVRTENGISYGDLPEYMDFEYLRKNTCLNLCNLANLAKSPPMPQDVSMVIGAYENTVTLTWKAPATGNAKGYYVMMRETTSAVWQKKVYITANQMTLPYSRDTYFFAVQAVSNDGNEGLPVIPKVVRRQAPQVNPPARYE